MKDGFVEVASFPEPILANLAKTKLESLGIECILTNENVIRMDFFWSQALGGVQLLVPEKDLQAAKDALAGSEEGSNFAGTGPQGKPDVICPKCQSDNVYHERRPRLISTICFFLGIPFILFKRNYRCAACEYKWKP